MSAPVVVPGPGVTPGQSASIPLPLPRGRWQLSIQYVSSFNVKLRAEGSRWTMPAYLGRVGPFFNLGAVTGRGVTTPVTLTFTAPRPSPLSGNHLFAAIPFVAATRLPNSHRVVPLRDACGRYVDWYRVFRG